MNKTIGCDTFEYEREMIDVTYGGLFGGEADTHKVYVPGLAHYRINGQLVTEKEFLRRLKKAQRKYDPR